MLIRKLNEGERPGVKYHNSVRTSIFLIGMAVIAFAISVIGLGIVVMFR